MDPRPSWTPPDVDIERPSPARIYDYHLGGSHNFAVDRAVGDQIAQIMPELPLILRANRRFLGVAVRRLVEAGIRQFLDLGSGIPTAGNVHEITEKVAPGSRVVYIDIDPVAVAHAQALLKGNATAAAVRADVRDVDRVLGLPEVREMIDITEPVGLLMVAVLHFIPDSDDPAGITARYVQALAPGSYVVMSHAAASEDEQAPAGADQASREYSRTVADTTLRTRAQVTKIMNGLDLLPPGVTYVTDWSPDITAGAETAQRLAQLVAIGRKP